jgi:hypothetical protein
VEEMEERPRTSNISEIAKRDNILRPRHPAIFVSTFIYSNTAVGKYYGIWHVEHMFLKVQQVRKVNICSSTLHRK